MVGRNSSFQNVAVQFTKALVACHVLQLFIRTPRIDADNTSLSSSHRYLTTSILSVDRTVCLLSSYPIPTTLALAFQGCAQSQAAAPTRQSLQRLFLVCSDVQPYASAICHAFILVQNSFTLGNIARFSLCFSLLYFLFSQ